MTSKQLGEFADQKTLQDYAELHGLEYAWEGTSAFRKRRRLARVLPEHYQLAAVAFQVDAITAQLWMAIGWMMMCPFVRCAGAWSARAAE